jgi:hypothetical protein
MKAFSGLAVALLVVGALSAQDAKASPILDNPPSLTFQTTGRWDLGLLTITTSPKRLSLQIREFSKRRCPHPT